MGKELPSRFFKVLGTVGDQVFDIHLRLNLDTGSHNLCRSSLWLWLCFGSWSLCERQRGHIRVRFFLRRALLIFRQGRNKLETAALKHLQPDNQDGIDGANNSKFKNSEKSYRNFMYSKAILKIPISYSGRNWHVTLYLANSSLNSKLLQITLKTLYISECKARYNFNNCRFSIVRELYLLTILHVP